MDDILELHEAGLYDQEIAEILGCDRSNITIRLNKYGVKNRHGKKDDLELRNRISDSLIGRYCGENNPNYKGYRDVKGVARGIFKTFSKRAMREKDYTCAHCGKRGGDLETHHIKPFSVILQEFIDTQYDGNIDTVYNQLMSYDDFVNEDNLVVLCARCHHDVHYSDNPELSPYRWESATTIESLEPQ